jgi:transcriptional regulator with XRE-family HTH domain
MRKINSMSNGMTQIQLAELTNMAQSRISVLCNNLRLNSSFLIYLKLYHALQNFPFLEGGGEYFDFLTPQEMCKEIKSADLLEKTVVQKIVGERLAWVRKHRGITWTEMAEDLRMTQAYFKSLEEGKQMTTLERLIKICRYLNVSLASILLGFYPETLNPKKNAFHASTTEIKETVEVFQ